MLIYFYNRLIFVASKSVGKYTSFMNTIGVCRWLKITKKNTAIEVSPMLRVLSTSNLAHLTLRIRLYVLRKGLYLQSYDLAMGFRPSILREIGRGLDS